MLNDNDKQRIEQEAETRYPFRHLQQTVFKEAAEYTTLYERESWIKQCEILINQRNEITELSKKEINRLEAERSDLINLLRRFVNDTGAVQTNLKAIAEQYLNSLKTK